VDIWEIFDGLPRAYGTYQVTEIDGQKLSGTARTVQAKVTEDIWELHLNGERSLGIVPIRDDNTVVFASIDIDTYPLDLEALDIKIEQLSLPLMLCRSKSGGAHLHLFIKPPGAMAEKVRAKLAEWSAELGFAGVEIFPKQNELRNKDDVGNWINMPYFGGDEDDKRYAIVKGERASLSKFCLAAQQIAISHAELDDIELTDDNAALLEGAPPCLNTLMRTGFTSSRNIALFNIGVYCKKRWEDEWQDKLDEFNDVLIDPPLSIGEVAQIKRNLDKKTYFYKCNDSPINAVCQKGLCRKKPFGIGGGDSLTAEGVKVEGPIRMMTEEVYHIATINGKRVYLNSHAMCGQHAFRLAVMSQTGFLVPNMKPGVFGKVVNDITLNAQEVDAPQYSGKRGLIVQEVLSMASGTNVAENWTQCLSGLPLPDGKGGVFLHPHQAVRVMKRRLQMRDLLPQQVMEALLADDIKVKEKKKGGRVFWHLPDITLLNEFEEEETL
jgi:hypothetical protein